MLLCGQLPREDEHANDDPECSGGEAHHVGFTGKVTIDDQRLVFSVLVDLRVFDGDGVHVVFRFASCSFAVDGVNIQHIENTVNIFREHS